MDSSNVLHSVILQEETEQVMMESSLIIDGRKSLQKYKRDLSLQQMEMVIRDLTFPMFIHYFDISRGTITDFGKRSIDEFSTISNDMKLLCSYFTRHHEKPQKAEQIANEFNSPYSFLRFIKELFLSLDSMFFNMIHEKLILSKVVLQVLIASKKFLLIPTRGELISEVIKLTTPFNEEDRKFLSEVILNCYMQSVVHPLAMNSGESLTEPVRVTVLNSINATGQIIDTYHKRFGLMTSFVHENTYIHQQLNLIKNQWICDISQNQQLHNAAMSRLMMSSKRIGYLIGNKNPTANMYISFKVRWEPKVNATRISYSSFFEVTYAKTRSIFELQNNAAEMVLPVYESKPIISVRFLYILAKFDGMPVVLATEKNIGELCEFTITDVSKDTALITDFKHRKRAIAQKYGSILTTIQFYSPDTPIEIPMNCFSSLDINFIQILDSMVTNLVKNWLQFDKSIPTRPPQEMHIGLFEFAYRHAIPSSAVYCILLKKFFEGWCESESYIMAFTGVYTITFAAIQLCDSTQSIREMFSAIVDSLKEKIPGMLLNHLSRPWNFEKPASLPLLTLFTLVFPEEESSAFIEKLFVSAKYVIMTSLIKPLKPIRVDLISPNPSESLIELLLEMQRSLPPDEIPTSINNSTFDQIQSLPRETISFSNECLTKCLESLVSRMKKIRKYYELLILPSSNELLNDVEVFIKSLSISIVKVFCSRSIENDDPYVTRFIVSYSDIYDFYLPGEEFSPHVLFKSIMIDYVKNIGDKMKGWVIRAIEHDSFDICNRSEMSSTSLHDMMTIFNQSYSSVMPMQLNGNVKNEIINCYISECKGCIKLYVDTLIKRVLAYFPGDIVFNNMNNQCFLDYLQDLRSGTYQALTPEAIYMIINNFVAIRSRWQAFLNFMASKYEQGELPEDFSDPFPSLFTITKGIPPLFAGIIADELTREIYSRIWVKNTPLRRLFVMNSSTYILHPSFENRRSDFFIQLYDDILNRLKFRIDTIQGTIIAPFRLRMFESIITGFDIGFMNLYLLSPENEPIKHKRILPLLQFSLDVMNDLYQYTQTIHSSISESFFVQYSWRIRYFLDHIAKRVGELIQIESTIDDPQKGLCLYLIIRSHTADRQAIQWSESNQQRYSFVKFAFFSRVQN